MWFFIRDSILQVGKQLYCIGKKNMIDVWVKMSGKYKGQVWMWPRNWIALTEYFGSPSHRFEGSERVVFWFRCVFLGWGNCRFGLGFFKHHHGTQVYVDTRGGPLLPEEDEHPCPANRGRRTPPRPPSRTPLPSSRHVLCGAPTPSWDLGGGCPAPSSPPPPPARRLAMG